MQVSKLKTFRALCAVICLIGILGFVVSQTLHSSAAEETGGRTLTLVCKTDDASLAGVDFSVYLVGERDSGETFAMNSDFSGCMTAIDDFSTSAVEAAALSLSGYAADNELTPTVTGVTDENAQLTISVPSDGLYLICGSQTTVDGKQYTPVPVLIEIDGDSADVISYTKFTVADVTSSSQTSDSETDSFTGSSTDSAGEGTTHITVSDESSDSSSSDSSNSGATGTTATEKIPQTGQLWWPVPILLLLGVTFIGIGYKIAVKKDSDK